MRYKTLIISLPLLLLSGCIPQIQKADPVTDKRVASELSALSGEFTDKHLDRAWWKAYNDPQLDAMVSKALASSPSILTVKARYSQAGAIIASVESKELPNVSAQTGLVRERFSENHIFPSTFLGGSHVTQYQTGIGFDYDFDFWDKRHSQILSAKEEAFSQLASIEAAKLTLASSMTEVYVAWHFDQRRLIMLSHIEKTAQEECSITQKRFKLGLSDASGMYQCQSVLEGIRQQQFALQRAIEEKKSSLCILGGFLPSYAKTLHTPRITDRAALALPKNVMLDFVSHRPDIAAAKHTALSKSHKIDEAKARFYPDISLSGLVELVSFDWSKFLSYSSYQPSAGIALSLPLLDWGEREANLNNNAGDYNASVYTYNQTVIKAANEVVVLLKQKALIEQEIQMHQRVIQAKHADSIVAERKFGYALANKSATLLTQRAEMENEMEGLTLAYEREMIRIALIRSLGGGYREEARP